MSCGAVVDDDGFFIFYAFNVDNLIYITHMYA